MLGKPSSERVSHSWQKKFGACNCSFIKLFCVFVNFGFTAPISWGEHSQIEWHLCNYRCIFCSIRRKSFKVIIQARQWTEGNTFKYIAADSPTHCPYEWERRPAAKRFRGCVPSDQKKRCSTLSSTRQCTLPQNLRPIDQGTPILFLLFFLFPFLNFVLHSRKEGHAFLTSSPASGSVVHHHPSSKTLTPRSIHMPRLRQKPPTTILHGPPNTTTPRPLLKFDRRVGGRGIGFSFDKKAFYVGVSLSGRAS